MPKVKSPIPGCSFETQDLDTAIVAALITARTITHTQGLATVANVEKVKRPVISATGTREEWSYFISRWVDYMWTLQK